MILEFVLLAFVVALIRGGSFRTLAALKMNHLWLAFVAPAMIILLSIARHFGFEMNVLRVSGILHILSIAPWLALLWINRKLNGAMILAFGMFLNFWPVAFNAGKMPVSMRMVHVANMGTKAEQFMEHNRMERHVVMSKDTRFNYLADWIPCPKPPFYLQPGVASPGDVVDTLGMFILIQAAMGVSIIRKPRNEAST